MLAADALDQHLLQHLLPLLSVRDVINLERTSRAFRDAIHAAPEAGLSKKLSKVLPKGHGALTPSAYTAIQRRLWTDSYYERRDCTYSTLG